MTILMTGSHGFVGTNLIEAFETTYNIIRWDARDDKPLPKCDVVIHLAGLAHDTKHTIEVEKYFEVNTELTKRIYDRFLESKAKKFIFFSSIKAKDNDTLYAKSKKKAEEYILNTDISDYTDKRFYILRPCMIHGKGNKGNLNLLVKWVKKGLPWPLAAFENKRSFASMENVSFIVEQLIKKDVESGVYEICDDEPVSTNELIGIISGCTGNRAKLLRIPQSFMKAFAKFGDWMQLPLNSERLGKLTENYVVDNRKIKSALCISNLPLKAIEGLKYSVECLIKD
jgi:nucleoside-diphosphate-sugar epimerase